MKTIADIMIINSQNVKPEHLVISSHHNISFQRRKLCFRQDEFQRSRQHWAARTAAVLLDDLKYLTCVHAATI